jgi:hypothetical protein
MASEVSSFPSYSTYSQYQPYGRDYGNPLFNAAMFGMFGYNYAPKPGEGQDYTDAEMERTRSRDFMDIQGNAFSHNMLAKMAGISPDNKLLQFAGKAFGSPDGAAARMLSPLIGGNPMAAQEQLFAGLQGANIMGAFGRPEGVSAKETQQMMDTLNHSFYKQQGMDDTVDKETGKTIKGVTSQMNEEFSRMLISNPEYAKQEGFGVPLLPSGKEDTGASEKFKREGKERKTHAEDLFKASDDLDLNEAKRGTKEFNEDLSKKLNEHIKKVLEKAGNMTEEQLKQYQDSNGIVKKSVIQQAGNEQLTRAAVESAGLDYEKVKGAKLSDIADKMHESRVSRNIQRNIINSARLVSDSSQDEVDKLSSISRSERSKDQQDQLVKAETRAKEAQKTIKQQLMAAGVKESEIDKHYETKGGIKRLSTEYLNSKQEDLAKHSYGEYKAEQYRQYKEAGGRFQGINFENTRGFNIEDFTSSFKSAAELNLLGSKGTPKEKFDDFLKNSGGTLSAARGVFGNKSGGELVTKISDLLGSKAADLSTKGGSQEVEKYLRDMKATARIAGVSMNAMLDTIDAAKALAKNNPRLQYMSAAATTDMTVKAFQTTSAMSGVLSSTDVRRAGGTQGMVAAHVSEQQKLQSSDIGQSLVALRQRFAGDPQKEAALERALGKFDRTGVNGKDIPNLVNEIMAQPEMKDESRGSLMNAMNNTALREMGMKNDTFVKKNADMMNKGFEGAMYSHLFSNTRVNLDKGNFDAAYAKAKADNDEARKKDPTVRELTKNEYKVQFTKEQLAKQYSEAKKKNDEARKKDPSVAELSFDDFMSTAVGKDPYSLNVYNQMRQTVQESIMRQVNPEYFKTLDRKRDNESRLDAQLDKKFGARNAPVITQIVSALAEGGPIDEGKTNQLLDVFGGQNGYTAAQTGAMTAGFGTAIAAAKGGDITGDFEKTAQGLSQATGEKITGKDIKNMAAAGFEDDDVDKAKTRLAELRKASNLGETQKMQLAALEKEEKLGILSSKNAYSVAKKSVGNGHDASAITAATIEGQKDIKINEQFEATKQEILHGGKDEKGQPTVGLDQYLSQTAKELKNPEQEQALNAAIGAYKGDDEKMIQEAKEGTGTFKAGGELEKKLGDKFNMIKSHVAETGDTLEKAKEQAMGKMGDDKDKEGGDMAAQLKALTKGLDDSKLTKALELIASKV